MNSRIWKAALPGIAMGFLGGTGFVAAIFPFVIGNLFQEIPGMPLLLIMDYAGYVALLWGIGGGVAAWRGGFRQGALIMGFCGLVAGPPLGAYVGENDLVVILAGGLTGLLYAAPAGLLIGGAFRRQEEEPWPPGNAP